MQLAKTTSQLVNGLVDVLNELLGAHEQLGMLLEQKRAALSGARFEQVTQLCERENGHVRRISELETQRLELVAALTLHVQPNAAEPMRMGDLAERLAEPDRGRLLVLRKQLLDRMSLVRRQTGITRRATQSLAGHMQGLMQNISALCSGVSLYNGQGAPPQQAMQVSTFNTTA